MTMPNLDRALEIIALSHEGRFHGGAAEKLIIAAEKALGTPFPPTYRTFLARLGCGSFRGDEFYGLIDDNFDHSTVPNGVWVTLDERRSAGLPRTMIVIGVTGDGGCYALDTARMSAAGENPVVEWWPSDDAPPSVVANDFGDFLYQCVATSENGDLRGT